MASKKKTRSRTRGDRNRVLYGKRKSTGRHVKNARRSSAPSARQQLQDNRASGALRRMREGETLESASRAEGTNPRTVRKYAGPAIRRRRGKYIYDPRKDKALRHVVTPASRGDVTGSVSRKDASRIAQYRYARKLSLSENKKKRRKGERLLREFRGKKYRAKGKDGRWRTHRFETRRAKIKQMHAQGRLEAHEFYKVRGRR